MRNEEVCMSTVSLILAIDKIMKSKNINLEIKKTLAEDLRNIIRKVELLIKLVEKQKGDC